LDKVFIRFACLLLFVTLSNSAFAETKTFIKEYTYQASELDSLSSSRMLALEQVKRLLLEELGVFLTSQTEVVHSQLTKDQILSITAGIVSATVLDEKWNGHQFWLKAQITADPQNVLEAIKAVVNDVKKSESLKIANKKIDDLKLQLEIVKKNPFATETERQRDYNKIIDKLSAADLMLEYWSIAYSDTGEITKAKRGELVQYLSRIISKDSTIAEAYFARAYNYMLLEMYKEAIGDFLYAAKANYYPDQAYSHLARIYQKLHQYDKYVEVLFKALSNSEVVSLKHLDYPKLTDKEYATLFKKTPNDSRLYLIRARDYFSQGSFGGKYFNDKKNTANFLNSVNRSLKLNAREPIAYLMLAEHYRDQLMPNMDIDQYEKIAKECLKYCSMGLQYSNRSTTTEEFLFMRANYGNGILDDRTRMNDYERLVALKPDATTYIKSLAELKLKFRLYNDALYLYDKILEIDSKTDYENKYDIYQSIGDVYLAMNKIASAIDMYNNAIDDMNRELSRYAVHLETNKNDSTTIWLADSLKSEKAKLLDYIAYLKTTLR